MKLILFLSLLWAPVLLSQIVTVEENGVMRDYEVSCEELQCLPASGGVAHAVKIEDQKTIPDTLKFAKALGAESGNRLDLVLYPAEGKKDKRSRRSATRRIVIELAPGTEIDKIKEEAEALSATIPDFAPNFLILDFASAGDSLFNLTSLREIAGVLSANPLLAKSRAKRLVPNDPRYAYSSANPRYQWHLNNTGENGAVAGIDANLSSVWDDYLGTGITIAIVDDGLEVDHPDLAPNANTAIDHDWNDATPDDPTPDNSFDDHGTACAGVAAARGDNGIGVSGAAPRASLVGLRLIAAGVSDADEAEAMNWRGDVIEVKSNSWGPFDARGTLDDSGPLVKAAFKNSVENGRGGLGSIHVWAAGNGGSNDNVNFDGYASSIYTIAVGAVTDTGQRSGYSEPGSAKLISAPSDGGGQAITTTTLVDNGSYTDRFNGTSSATPLVSGVCALILEANPNLGWRDVQEILIQSAVKLEASNPGWKTNSAGFDFSNDYGAGLVDADAAINLALGWTNLPEQQSISKASGSVEQPIPDNSATGARTTFDLTAEAALRAEHVTITANITHPNRGELTLSLTSPNGTESLLSVPHSPSGANFTNWKLMTVHNWGENSQGLWTLEVRDSVTGQSGILKNATLEIFGAPTAPITDPPEFTSATSASGNLEAIFSFNVRANNATSSYRASGLPSGLTIEEVNGRISGVPLVEGTFLVELTATNAIGSSSSEVTITIGPRIPAPPFLITTGPRDGIAGRPFQYQIEATNSPTSYQASSLPDGLVLDSATGSISGTPTTVATTSVTLTVMNQDGSDSGPLTFRILAPGTGPLPTGLDTTDFIYELSGQAGWVLTTTTGAGGDSVTSEALGDSQKATFSSVFNGPGLVRFSWKVSSEAGYDFLTVSLDGERRSAIAGIRDWSEGGVVVPPGQHTVSWSYEKDGSDDGGEDRGWVDALTFTPGDFSRTVGEALDYPGLPWRPLGNGPAWRGQILTSEDGDDAAQAGNARDLEESILSVALDGPGAFSFSYRVDSELDYDLLTFTLDGTEQFSLSGQVPWTRITLQIPAGNHTLQWLYQKDSSASDGADTAWLDRVLWEPAGITGYQQWRNLHFSLDEQSIPEIGGDHGDPDGDGHANLLEYALSLDPLEPDLYHSPPLALLAGDAVFQYQVDTSKSDLIYEAQTSSDLTSWTTRSSSVVSHSGSIETRRVSVPYNGDLLFFRYQITPLP